MSFEEPTYEEYKSASEFARVRYKYGLFVTVACWLCLLFIIYYMVTNAEALGSDPMQYAMQQKPNLECHCYEKGFNFDKPLDGSYRINFFINSTNKWVGLTNVPDTSDLPTPEELQKMLNNLGK